MGDLAEKLREEAKRRTLGIEATTLMTEAADRIESLETATGKRRWIWRGRAFYASAYLALRDPETNEPAQDQPADGTVLVEAP